MKINNLMAGSTYRTLPDTRNTATRYLDPWAGLVFRTGWFECLPGFGAIGWRTQSAG